MKKVKFELKTRKYIRKRSATNLKLHGRHSSEQKKAPGGAAGPPLGSRSAKNLMIAYKEAKLAVLPPYKTQQVDGSK